MARVTVEDCIEIVPSRFELVALASKRARDISAGAPPTVDRDNDKNAVIALREIAGKTVDAEELREAVIRGMQQHLPSADDSDADLDSELQAELESVGGSSDDNISAEQIVQSEAETQLNIMEEDDALTAEGETDTDL